MTAPSATRHAALALVAIAAFAGCSDSDNKKKTGEGKTGDTPGGPVGEEPDPNDPIPFPEGSPERGAIDTLAAIESPALGDNEACAAYGASLASFFATLDHETRRLADVAPEGIPPMTLGRFAGWLATREQVLGALEPKDEELARRHEELTAAVGDLSEAFGLFVPGQNDAGAPPAPRVANAVANFVATLEAIAAHCER